MSGIFGSIFGPISISGAGNNTVGTVADAAGSPQIDQALSVSGDINFSLYVALAYGGVQEGARIPAAIQSASWTASVTPTRSGSYTVQLWTAATGGVKLDETAPFTVVPVSYPPVIPAGQTFSIAENASIGTPLGIIATTGGTPNSWAITAGNTGTAFALNDSGLLEVASTLDYETTAVYYLTVQATNIGGAPTATVIVSVLDVLDTVPTVVGGQSFSVSESAPVGTVVGTVATTGSPATSFSIQSGNTGTAFAISATGVITTLATLSFAGTPSYTLGIRATNAVGNSPTVNVGVAVNAATPVDTVVQFTLEGTGAGANAIVPFAHMFKQGDIPQGAAIVAKRASDSTAYNTQFNVIEVWPDSSVKQALICIQDSAGLADGSTQVFNLVKNEAFPTPGANLDMAALLASRSATVTISPTGAGTAQTFDLIALLPATRFRTGPLGVEARVEAAINAAAVGGTTTARLVVDMLLLKDGALYLDVGVRNDAVLLAGFGTLGYSITATVDGGTALSFANISQTTLKWFQRRAGMLSTGVAAPTRPYVRHDTAYLAHAGAVSNYDTALGVDESKLATYAIRMSSPTWNVPLDNRFIVKNMTETSEREDIGIVPGWCAAWLTSYDRRAQDYGMGVAEAAMGIPWNLWDATKATWMNAVDRPGYWADSRDARFFPLNTDATWIPDPGHAPDCNFVPWILTGRRACMDAVMAQASWCIMARSPSFARGTTTAADISVNGLGVRVIYYAQIRESAWSMRSLSNAGWGVPLAYQPFGNYFARAVVGNFNFANASASAWQTASGEPYGYPVPFAYGSGNGLFAPWQMIYGQKVFSVANKRGITGASQYSEWVANFTAGSFLQSTFYPSDSFQYNLRVGISSNTGPYYQTWAALEANLPGASYGPDPSNLGGANNSYPDSGMEALATFYNASPQDPRAARALRWPLTNAYITSGTGSNANLQNAYQKFSVLPYGWTRAGSLAPTVVAAQTYGVLEASSVGTDAAVVQTTGGIPVSFAITGGNTDGDWTIDNAGVLTTANALNFGTKPSYSLTVTATNANGTSAGVAVVIDVLTAPAVAPVVTDGLSFSIAANATLGTAAGTVTTSAGSAPITWSITGGNTGSAWAIGSSTGIITQNQASLDWGAVPSYTLTVQALNSAGSDTASVGITPLLPPVVTAGQTFSITDTDANGTLVGTVATTAGTPTSFSITAGNTGSVFAISSGGAITKNGTLTSGDIFTLTIQATNAYGSNSGSVEITVLGAAAVTYDAPNTTFLAIYGLRQIVPGYTGNLIRVRRSSDNTEQDIGQSSGQLNETALTTFVGANTGYVVTMYDQTGNGMHVSQPTAADQPTITNGSGTIHRINGTGSRPGIRYTNSGGEGLYKTSFNSQSSTTNFGSIAGAQGVSFAANRRIISYSTSLTTSDSSGGGTMSIYNGSASQSVAGAANAGAVASVSNTSPNGTSITASIRSIAGSRSYLSINGAPQTEATVGTFNMLSGGALKIGFFRTDNWLGYDGYIPEVAVFGATTETDVTSMHTNIKAWIGI